MNVLVTGYPDGKKIHAIRAVRSASGIGLKEAKEAIDRVDLGAESEVRLMSPDHVRELDEGGVRYRRLQVRVPLEDFVAVLADYPRSMTVADLLSVLTVTAAHAKEEKADG